MVERWKMIGGSVAFAISSFGRVQNTHTGRIRKTPLVKGYARIRFEGRTRKVHRLVAEAFVPNPDGLPEVNHKDGCKDRNYYKNLEWATHQQNMTHASDAGLMPSLVGSSNGASKLTERQVLAIRTAYIPGIVRQVDLAAEYGVSQRAISLIVRKEKWTHV